MKLLVIGSGGREHALAWKLAQGPRVQKVYVAPGNAGTALEPGVENVPITDIAQLAGFAQENSVHLTVVGAAAQLESSKDFAKRFMQRHHIPTAAYATFSDGARAHAYLDKHAAPIVIKADGLAAGKGVVVAMTAKEAHEAV